MRVVLSMLDLAAPYVNIYEEEIVSDQLNIKWNRIFHKNQSNNSYRVG